MTEDDHENGCDTCRLHRRLKEVLAERDAYKRERDMLIRWLRDHGHEVDLSLVQQSILKDMGRAVGQPTTGS